MTRRAAAAAAAAAAMLRSEKTISPSFSARHHVVYELIIFFLFR